MDPEKLKEITQAASAAVKDLDPDLKSLAFQTILEKLLAKEEGGPRGVTARKTKRRIQAKGRSGGSARGGAPSDDTTKKLLEGINRSKYPAMHNLKTTKEKSLYILQIAKDEQGVDGLTPPQISRILDQTFRVKATPQAVSMALMGELKFVDRKPAPRSSGGKVFSYRIMHSGEQHLKGLLDRAEKAE